MKYEIVQQGMSLKIGFFYDVSQPINTKQEAITTFKLLLDNFENDKHCYMHGLDYEKHITPCNRFSKFELPHTRYEDEETLQYYDICVRPKLEDEDYILSESEIADKNRHTTLLYNLITYIESIDQQSIFESGVDAEINITREEYNELMEQGDDEDD